MNELLDDIEFRASVTPSLPAVRLGGQMVTYGALDESIASFETVMDRHSMSRHSALFAALLHTLPGLTATADPAEQGRLTEQVIGWLGRNLASGAERDQRSAG
ncbi:MAG: hypothetical protein QM662_08255 [Gordonia sp. (in: high G+C Gram-positive bacteria)]